MLKAPPQLNFSVKTASIALTGCRWVGDGIKIPRGVTSELKPEEFTEFPRFALFVADGKRYESMRSPSSVRFGLSGEKEKRRSKPL